MQNRLQCGKNNSWAVNWVSVSWWSLSSPTETHVRWVFPPSEWLKQQADSLKAAIRAKKICICRHRCFPPGRRSPCVFSLCRCLILKTKLKYSHQASIHDGDEEKAWALEAGRGCSLSRQSLIFHLQSLTALLFSYLTRPHLAVSAPTAA